MRYDTLIEHGKLLDGSGAPAADGSVALRAGVIAAVGRLDGAEADRVIDAAGRIVTPGFLDIHRHGDAALFFPDYGEAEVRQGLTTVVNGNCGLSLAPMLPERKEEILRYLAPITGPMPEGREFPTLAEYFRQAAERPLALNVGELVGGGTLRAGAAGLGGGALSDGQRRQVWALLERALADGALGVSLGLGYAPECFYSTEQLIEVLAPLRGSGRVITVHMRQEGSGVEQALAEMLTVAEALETPVEISHLKAIGRKNWGKSVPRMLERIAGARERGLDVSCDVYPYTAGSTQLLHVLPPEAQKDGLPALEKALKDPAVRRDLRVRMETGEDFENIVLLAGFENILATGLRSETYRELEGKSLAEIAVCRGEDPYDSLFDLLAAEHCGPSMIDFIAEEEDLAAILRVPFTSVISDATYPGAGLLHPRVYGMAAWLLQHFVRETGVLSLPEAVNRLTRRPADRFGLTKKGRLAPGADADLLIFDPENIRARSTYAQPRQFAAGMDWVLVGGRPVLAEGVRTDAFPGKVLRS